MRRPFFLPEPLAVPLSAADRQAVDTLKSATGLVHDAELVRLALWRLAEHYDLRLPLDTFAIASPAGKRRRAARRRAL